MPKRKLLIEIYKQTQVAHRYYAKRGVKISPIQAYKRFYLDQNIDLEMLESVIDEGYALQKSMLKEAKKRKK